MKVKYRPNYEKILEAVVYIARKFPGCGFHHILKVLFYADKFHLQKYGQPILGDSYIKMSAGPVGSYAYDILKQSDFLPTQYGIEAGKALAVDRSSGMPSVQAKRDADMQWFSESDVECLHEALRYCEGMGFHDLCQATHQEPAWLQASINQEMDYELFLDEDVEHREELLEYIRETSQTIAL